MQLSEEEWKAKLTPEQYRVLRQKGTEAPFSGELINENRDGMFKCAACGAELFSSEHKFESTASGLQGWPSFSDIAKSDAVKLIDDNSLGVKRTEVQCATCGSHLGHVFDEAEDQPGGKHYCINSVCLDFESKDNHHK
ncbi:peptide-methionine (R)-S-oxide reductase MsrB [Candidatus Parcubacteria bacterium]|nr:peptide-methionine (R)-S-oxide reductase MsrB [Candidatus Parcubacteria bacterium]